MKSNLASTSIGGNSSSQGDSKPKNVAINLAASRNTSSTANRPGSFTTTRNTTFLPSGMFLFYYILSISFVSFFFL